METWLTLRYHLEAMKEVITVTMINNPLEEKRGKILKELSKLYKLT